MRKSTAVISLTLLASVSAASIYLLMPDDPNTVETSEMFPSVAACMQKYDADSCSYGDAVARQEFSNSKDTYSTIDSCQTGGQVCSAIARPDGTIVFGAAMAGFMIGHLSSGGLTATPFRYGRSPDCQSNPSASSCVSGGNSNSRYVYSPHGVYVGSFGGNSYSSAAPVVVSRGGAASVSSAGTMSSSVGSVSSVSRGGFGATAAGHAGGGE